MTENETPGSLSLLLSPRDRFAEHAELILELRIIRNGTRKLFKLLVHRRVSPVSSHQSHAGFFGLPDNGRIDGIFQLYSGKRMNRGCLAEGELGLMLQLQETSFRRLLASMRYTKPSSVVALRT